MAQRESREVSTPVIKDWRKRGAFAYKVHGGPMQAAGIPDISGTYKGWSVWCESKVGRNKPSKIQRYRINAIRRAGGLVVVAYSVGEAADLLNHIDSGNHLRKNCPCPYSTPFDLSHDDDDE